MLAWVDDQRFVAWLPDTTQAAGRRLAGLGTSCPVRVGVNIARGYNLLHELLYESGHPIEVAANPLEGSPGVLGGLGHPPAYFFASKLQIYAVCGEVVPSGARTPERGRQSRRQWDILL